MSIIHCVSVSGGKDSAATAILALETQPRASLRFIFCDTGNEHESTYDYVRYMESHLGIQITTLRADFSRQIANKREYILNKWPGKGVPQADCERAAAALVATGNPFLDLCIWKGRFPSRRAQFCTTELKTIPATEHQLELIDSGQCDAVWNWQGIRMDESHHRHSKMHISGHMCRYFGEQGAGIYTYRPLLRWTAFDVFEAADCYRLKPNPLYLQGMTRVGCMPCINAGKDEILEISKRFPGHIDRVEMWEIAVSLASKRQAASFFPDPDRDAHLNKRGIRNVVQWSKTQRGGQLMDFIRISEEPKACESAYGLCE